MASELLGDVIVTSEAATGTEGFEVRVLETSVERVVSTPVVSVRNLERSFNSRSVLRGVDLDIPSGEFVALLGHSGSGKSTLLRSLAQLDLGSTGTVEVPDARAVVFQEPRLIPWKRVWHNVVLGLPGTDRRNVGRPIALAALAEVGLADHADAWPVTLSGGEAQRVALARALVREPLLLLLDEPLGALDALTRLKMHGLVQQLWERHHPAALLVTHDVDEALVLADRVLVLTDGRISLDLRVNLARPRRRSGTEFGLLRSRLLTELGVDESAL